MLATERGREFAQERLAWRRAHPPVQIDNAALYAGMAMYFYCSAGGHVAEILPEDYLVRTRRLCAECQALKDCGWLE
jgi:hypothetical protein